jgi:indolepyruvate decarboxylase
MGVTRACEAFLTQSQIPFATTPMDKGLLPESHPGFLGIYNGVHSSPPDVAQRVAEADLILDIGGVVLEDINTGFWTDRLDAERLITLGDHYVTVGQTVFTGVTLNDMLAELAATTPVIPAQPATPAAPSLLPMAGTGDERLSSAAVYPRLQRLLQAGDILVAETGTCILQIPKLRLPAGVGYQTQTLWGSIGWGTPAALGIALADPGKRIILVTGDGAHQCTANELGVMGRYGLQPIIFVLNNGLYGVEEVVGEKGHVYDQLAAWDYQALPAAMGCKDWFTARVSTVNELEQAIAALLSNRTAAYIEVLIPPEESQPLPDAILQRLYKATTPE